MALHPNLPLLYITHRGQARKKADFAFGLSRLTMDYLLFFQFEAIVSFDILGEEEGYLRQRQVYELDLKEHRWEKQENRIVFCLYSQVQVKGRNFSHKLLGCNVFFRVFIS